MDERVDQLEPSCLLIALGRMIAVLPESVARGLGHGLVAIPVDGRRTTLPAAWPEERHDRALATFVRAAVETADGTAAGAAGSPAGGAATGSPAGGPVA